MAEKWADYVITAVRFNVAGTHIEYVQSRTDNGETLSAPSSMSRREVVSKIESGYSFCTATKSGQNKWTKGAMLKIVTIHGEKFIKTKADSTKVDNLDNLPTF
jgi:hypothetical protein